LVAELCYVVRHFEFFVYTSRKRACTGTSRSSSRPRWSAGSWATSGSRPRFRLPVRRVRRRTTRATPAPQTASAIRRTSHSAR